MLRIRYQDTWVALRRGTFYCIVLHSRRAPSERAANLQDGCSIWVIGVKPRGQKLPVLCGTAYMPPASLITGMSRELFIECMGRRLALVDPVEEVRNMFKAFDIGCRGFITRDDLRQV